MCRIMPYDPRHPYHLRYQTEWQAPKEILQKVEQGVLQLNQYLGYDLNTVEFAVRDGVPVAIDFCNPAPDAEVDFGWSGELSNGWSKRSRTWRFAKRASINPVETI